MEEEKLTLNSKEEIKEMESEIEHVVYLTRNAQRHLTAGNDVYSEDIKIVPPKIQDELKHLHKTNTPRCIHCKKDWVQVDEYTWKPDCDCLKNNKIRMSIG